MRDRFDVQLGVARPVEASAPPEETPGATPGRANPVVVVEYRDRGVPFYLMPPLLIVLAALGIMSYQNMTTPYPVRRASQATVAASPSRGPQAVIARPGALARAATVPASFTAVPAAAEPARAAAPRPPLPAPVSPGIEVVETSAEKPAPGTVAPAPRPVVEPSDFFDQDTTVGLRPVTGAAPKRTATASEPPLVAPTPGS
jgi:hypothetical protein